MTDPFRAAPAAASPPPGQQPPHQTLCASSADAGAPASRVARLREGLQRHGVAGVTRRAGELTARAVRNDEAHLWYDLALQTDRPGPPLPPGVQVIRAGGADVGLLDELDTVYRAERPARLAAGVALWVALAEARPVFACWIFPRRLPVLAAPGGALALPPGVVALEDSIAASWYRGRGTAAGVWATVADALAGDGQQHLLTKVALDNVPVQRALAKAGFVPVAAVRYRRCGPRTQVTTSDERTPLGGWLGDALRH